jgi:NADPH:quinone reductase
MRAVQAVRFGGPDVLEWSEIPDATAGPGRVVVRAAVADILFVETQVRSGWGREYFSVEPPYVPGDGCAGEVIAVGEGVDRDWIGRRVVARGDGTGGYAEQVEVAADALVRVPDEVSLRDAAALLHDGVTALAVFEPARIKPAERVLVVAAAGGMGSLLVQLAHQGGARVIGAARGESKLALVRKLGADAVIDYDRHDWTDQVRDLTGGAGADVVFDGVGGATGKAAFDVTARGGYISAHGAPSGAFAGIDAEDAKRRGVTLRGIEHVQLTPDESARLLARALSLAAAGLIQPVIGQTFPLARAAEAHAAIEARQVVGKTLLEV